MFKVFLMKALFSNTEAECQKYLTEIEDFTFKIHMEEGTNCNYIKILSHPFASFRILSCHFARPFVFP